MTPAQSTPPSPPALPGFDYLDTLGSGGFADVYLYEQHLPRRRVAVKVLSGGALDTEATLRFRDEANVMAQLSSHPSILTVFQAGIAQSGEAYLVMEYCALPNYGTRFRRETISLEEALSVGVQIAGAVETAHRAGILHRDIKPANILVTDFNRPALADFGIAAVLGSSVAIDAYSVPWAAPESFGEGGVLRATSDVYSLAATIYTLLAGRAPFELTGGDNSPEAMIQRMRTTPAPPTGRADVAPDLEAELATALSPSPAARHTSALSFGRALQQLQRVRGLAVTTMDAIDDPFVRTGSTATTRPATAPTGSFAQSTTSPPTEPSVRAAARPLESTVRRAPSEPTAPVYTAQARRRARWPGILLDIVLVLGVAGAAAFLLLGGGR